MPLLKVKGGGESTLVSLLPSVGGGVGLCAGVGLIETGGYFLDLGVDLLGGGEDRSRGVMLLDLNAGVELVRGRLCFGCWV